MGNDKITVILKSRWQELHRLFRGFAVEAKFRFNKRDSKLISSSSVISEFLSSRRF